MQTIQRMSPRLGFSLAAALAVSLAVAGGANANPIPTTSDEARALAGNKPAPEPTKGTVAQVSQAKPHVTSTDEARAAVAASDNRTAVRQTARGSRARASVQRP